jgi:hypothetical protein
MDVSHVPHIPRFELNLGQSLLLFSILRRPLGVCLSAIPVVGHKDVQHDSVPVQLLAPSEISVCAKKIKF